MEEEVYLIDIVALLSAQSGWIIFFIFGIWLGVIAINFNLSRIIRELQKDNRKPFPEEEEVKYGVKYKYCFHGCSSPIDDTLQECPTCSRHSFVYRKPEETKKDIPNFSKPPRRTGHDNTWPPR
jgi:hypothetical protein